MVLMMLFVALIALVAVLVVVILMRLSAVTLGMMMVVVVRARYLQIRTLRRYYPPRPHMGYGECKYHCQHAGEHVEPHCSDQLSGARASVSIEASRRTDCLGTRTTNIYHFPR